MEFRKYLAVLARRKAIIAVAVLGALIAALIRTSLLPPVYEASTTLRLNRADELTDRGTYDSVMYAGRLANTYSKIATSSGVLEELNARLGLQERPKVKVDIPANTELMQITVEHHDPRVAADAANTVADIMTARIRDFSIESARTARETLAQRLTQAEADLEQATAASPGPIAGDGARASTTLKPSIDSLQHRHARLAEQYDQLRVTEATRANTVTVVERAGTPQAPSKPRLWFSLAVALVMGLVGGTGLALLFENLDTKLYTIRRIDDVAGLHLFGAILDTAKRQQDGLFNPGAPEYEAFRRIRTHILALGPDVPRTLLVTSAEPGEGKSTVVANLASAMAEVGRSVVVVDGDLRVPAQHTIFGLPNQDGLSSVLAEEATWAQVIRDSRLPNVRVITSGRPTPNPAALLGTRQMADLIEQLAQSFDVVLLDAPSLLAVADAVVLAPVVDGVVLIVARARAREEAVQAACSELAEVKAKTIGLVVNRAEPDASYRYYGRAVCSRADRPAPAMIDLSLGRGWGALRHLHWSIIATGTVLVCTVLLLLVVHWNAMRQGGAPPLASADPLVPTAASPGCEAAGASNAGCPEGGTGASLGEGLTAASLLAIAPVAAPDLGSNWVASQQLEPPRTPPGQNSRDIADPAVEVSTPASTAPTHTVSVAVQPRPSSASFRTILDEQFVDNRRGWPDDVKSTAWIDGGAYRVFAREPGRFVAIGAPTAGRLRNVMLTATFRKVGGPPGGGYGLIVRDRGAGPRDGVNQGGEYYVLEVGDRGEMGIWRREEDRWIDLRPWASSPAVRPGTSMNKLAALAIGEDLVLLVNGIEVARVSDPSPAEGAVGVFVGGDGNEVMIDQLFIETPE